MLKLCSKLFSNLAEINFAHNFVKDAQIFVKYAQIMLKLFSNYFQIMLKLILLKLLYNMLKLC